MIKAVETPRILLHIAVSISFQDVPQKNIASEVATAVVANKTTWLPPFNASLPKTLIVTDNNATNTTIGITDKSTEGLF